MKNKIIGIICFALGLILLIIVFIYGYNILTNESYYLTKKLIDKDLAKNFTLWITKSSMTFLALIIMTIVGSSLTNKGISVLLFDEKKHKKLKEK